MNVQMVDDDDEDQEIVGVASGQDEHDENIDISQH